jgi:GNAT superfamily N-acetyltransferase
MAGNENEDGKPPVTVHSPGDLSEAEIKACIELVKKGNAVNPESAAQEIPQALTLAVVRVDNQIVGVGTIKQVRRQYALSVAGKSGVTFPSETPELGYVAVDPGHQTKGFSPRIVNALLTKHEGRLFATTSNTWMKSTLEKTGFVQKGREWKSVRNEDAALSLWLKE